jgi:predicted O-methyltransferase YrrM
MNDDLQRLLEILYGEGLDFDAAEPDRLRRRRNLEPDAARLLWMIIRAMGAAAVVEVGTSNGYSTLWLADAVRAQQGRVISVDVDPEVQCEAARHLARAGLAAYVDLRAADGGVVLSGLPDASQDVVFLDSERPEYPGWWPHPVRVLRPGGLLVVDNVLSHPDEVAPLVELVQAEAALASCVVAIGKGELLAVKVSD